MPSTDTQLMTVFSEALERTDPAARASYLDGACRGNPELRHHVEELLAAHAGAGRFLEPAAAGAAGPALVGTASETEAASAERPDMATDVSGADGSTTDAASARPAAESARAVIAAKYTLAEPIGEGGMGSVWRARQTEPVKRYVAVKLIKAGMDSKQVLARFEAERQALALMDHPNIARVLDGGLHEGRPFFVMELVKGVPITEYCDARRLTPRQRLELFVPVCQAIQHAHQKGVIHRDIKPSNVLIALYDDKPVPKVIDFGVAKATGATLTERTIDTGFGGVVGTPQYMSPEQATLNNLDIDTRSDVYALGVLLYELLTGSTPFSRKELEKKGLLEILRVVREDEPPRPSTKLSAAEALPTLSANRGTEPRALTGLLRSELDWLVMKALEKDRSRRYEAAMAFAADVRRYLDGEAVQAHPPSAGYRLRKFARRHRGRVMAAAAVLLALVVGMAGMTAGLVRATRAAERERAAKQEALDSAAEERKAKETVEAVLGFVENRVFAAARPKGKDGGLGYDVKLADAVAAALPAIEGNFRGRPLTEARLRQTIGNSFNHLGKPDVALGQCEAALALYRRELGADHPDTLSCTRSLAYSYYFLGRHAEIRALLEPALPLMKARLGPDHFDTLSSMHFLAFSYADLGRHADAIKLHKEVLALRKARLGPEHPDTLSTMSALAATYGDLGRLAEALKLNEETLPLTKAKLGLEHPLTLFCMHCLAGNYYTLGRHAEALKLYEQSLALRKARMGPEHPVTLATMDALALAYAALGHDADALKLHERALALMKATLGVEHFLTLSGMHNVAVSYADLGRLADALKLHEEVLAVRKARLGPEHPDTLWSMSGLADTYAASGRRAEALQLAQQVLALRKAKFGPEHPDTLSTMTQLAACDMAFGSPREARALLEECSAASRNAPESARMVASLQTWYGFDQDYTASTRRILAWARGTDDDATAARAAQVVALRPTADPAVLVETAALARRAVERHDGQSERLALGMAEFRSGHLAEADDALRTAGIGPDVTTAGCAAFYRAMTRFQQGKKDEARETAAKAAAAMRPLPRDDHGPISGNRNANDLILWLAYKEAKAMIGFADPPTAPAKPDAE
jgi:eukaryotic-like serine/threonine-protein kinase